MAVPKLPLLVPKKALSTTSKLVPKLPPKISPALLPKSPAPPKSLLSGTKLPDAKPTLESAEPKPADKLTKLVSSNSFGSDKSQSSQEFKNVASSTPGDSNFSHTQAPPTSTFVANNAQSGPSYLNSRAASTTSLHEELTTRLSRTSLLSSQSAGFSKKTLSTSFYNEDGATSNTDLLIKPLSRESNGSKDGSNSATGASAKEEDPNLEDREDVGYTPWLRLEKRINQIRSMTSKDFKSKPGTGKPQGGPNIYNNYHTEFEDGGWKKELTHPLSYGVVQRLNDKRQFELPKDNWKFINGFLKPRRKPFTSMSEMSRYFQKVDTKDQYELIKLLLACRELEKVIEEQHTVLDMLDHDLREARDLFPESLNNVDTQKLMGSVPGEEPFFPSSEAPLFMKGRVFLLPKSGKVNK